MLKNLALKKLKKEESLWQWFSTLESSAGPLKGAKVISGTIAPVSGGWNPIAVVSEAPRSFHCAAEDKNQVRDSVARILIPQLSMSCPAQGWTHHHKSYDSWCLTFGPGRDPEAKRI